MFTTYLILKIILFGFDLINATHFKSIIKYSYVAYGLSVLSSLLYLIGFWLFSFRYLTVSEEINHLFNIESEATIARY